MFEILSSLLKYIFATVIYFFIFSVIRLIYLDIRSINNRLETAPGKHPYLKLINRRDSLSFKVEESYILDNNKTLGRSSKNDIAIQDPYLSSRHAEFIIKGDSYYIKDLESTNGTRVNGMRLADDMVRLDNGDKIQVGQLTFIFVKEY